MNLGWQDVQLSWEVMESEVKEQGQASGLQQEKREGWEGNYLNS